MNYKEYKEYKDWNSQYMSVLILFTYVAGILFGFLFAGSFI